jgi:hypothetical protein
MSGTANTFVIDNPEVHDEEYYEKYLKDFVMPEHSKNCKKCYGLGRIGFTYDTKTKTRKGPIPCPIYEKEISLALKLHIDEVNRKLGIDTTPRNPIKDAFDDYITGV